MMMKFSYMILVILLIEILRRIQYVLSGKRIRRVRTLPMIPIALVLMIFGSWELFIHADKIGELIAGRGDEEIARTLTNATYVLMNLSLMLGYILIKLIVRPIVSLVNRDKDRLKSFALSVYRYVEDYDEFFLKREWAQFRAYISWIITAAEVVSGAVLGYVWFQGNEEYTWIMIFPCAALVVLNELHAYLDGITKEEFEHSVMGEDADARRIGNYYKLREVLENLLPATLLSAGSGSDFMRKETPVDFLNSLEESEDVIDQITSEYFNINDRYKSADVDCVQATWQLMHRRNVVFFNPFYRDLTMYITLPLSRALLEGKKCVVLCGRQSAAADVQQWVEELLQRYSHMKTLWRVDLLSDTKPNCEVGIMTFTQLYDNRVKNANREFFKETDLVLMIEPSIMINTSQVALSILAEDMHNEGDKPVYCICDRNTDGLVDTLSHVLREEITDVVAMPVPRCTYSAMTWNADGDFARQQLFDKQTRYLGNGVELAAIAVKNQIPKVTWYGETKVPIRDIKWLAGQNYATICRYMNIPSQQKSLYEKIDFVANLWSAPKTKEQFIIAEDEFCNMFSALRSYMARGENQVFVNILSENYLLRDYMRCNKLMFTSNPNAIPSLIPDYAKTERNTILKLILMMASREVSEEEISQELKLTGIYTEDVFGAVVDLLKKYTYADESVITLRVRQLGMDELATISENMYSITEESFEKYFSDTLKNAYFILEDEKNEESYIDAKLFSHVTQIVLPGQFVTYDGKYYSVKYVSPQAGVVLRRASDQYDGRKYYRQVRSYEFTDPRKMEIVSSKKVMDIEFAQIRTDFRVTTTGFLEMKDFHDLRSARLVDFSSDPGAENYIRQYHNKNMFRIRLPEADEKIRFTVCLLLMEIFRTIYPDSWQYLAPMTRRPADIDGFLNYVVYPLNTEEDDEYIYIVEDSILDLGLLDSVEKNFNKIMEIMADFLDWHFDKMREREAEDPMPVNIEIDQNEVNKNRTLRERLFRRIQKLFGAKEEAPVKVSTASEAEAAKPADEKTGKQKASEEISKEAPKTGSESDTSAESTESTGATAAGVIGMTEDEVEEKAPVDTPVTIAEEAGPEAKSEKAESEEAGAEKTESEETTSEQAVPAEAESEDAEPVNAEPAKAEPVKAAEHIVSAPVEVDLHPEDSFEPAEEDPDIAAIDGTDIFEGEGMPADMEFLETQFEAMGLNPIPKTRYQRECYLKYGYEEIDGRIRADELRRYLRARGYCNNALTQARQRKVLLKTQLDMNAVNHCDFCGTPLSGVSYDRLNDGRVRCNDCSASAITTLEDFKDLFYQSLQLMQDFYEIRFKMPIGVHTADARTVNKGAGMIFRPSVGVAPRVLGYAQKKSGKYSLIIENGSPRLAATDTMIHEMTHIWQYLNWNDNDIYAIYRMPCKDCTKKARDILYEGMAMWASIQYLYQIGETWYASVQEELAAARTDIYGIGFRLYRDQYPLVKDSSLLKYSPFSTFPTLEPALVREAVMNDCGKPVCKCR